MPITTERVGNVITAELLQGLLILLSLLRLVLLQNKSPSSGTDRIGHVSCAVVPRGDSC